MLLPALHAVQDAIGYVSHGALNYISDRIPVAPAEAFGVATFYDLISTEELPAHVARICDDIVCIAKDGGELIADLEAEFGPQDTPNGEGMWTRSPCLGHCEKGSAAFIQRAGEQALTIAPVTATEIAAVLDGVPQATPTRELSAPLFDALDKARRIGADAVRTEVVSSGIRGRGGAAFPAGIKWNGVADAIGDDKYVVCNADESEPGTFKDRWLIEQDPFALLEGIAIASFAVGATKAYIYIRGEYREAELLLSAAIEAAGSDLDVEIEIRRGAGAYICGEETALFNSIEGFRGQPRATLSNGVRSLQLSNVDQQR